MLIKAIMNLIFWGGILLLSRKFISKYNSTKPFRDFMNPASSIMEGKKFKPI